MTKKESGKMNNNEQMALRLHSNNTIICQAQAADVFNKYFLNLTNILKSGYMDNGSAILFLKSSFPKGFPKVVKIPITEAELVSTISSLNLKNSPGYNGLSNKTIVM
jgi:hypothetical protein